MNKNFSTKFLVCFIVLLNCTHISACAKNVNSIKNFQIQNSNIKSVNNNPQMNNQLTQLENRILKSAVTNSNILYSDNSNTIPEKHLK